MTSSGSCSQNGLSPGPLAGRGGRWRCCLLPYLLAPLYRVVDPVSTLMLGALGVRASGSSARSCRSSGSRRCCRASVIASEDGRFCVHHGVDLAELQEAWRTPTISPSCAAARPSPSRPPRTCSSGRAAASSARRWSSRWRCGSTWCCPSGASWKSISTSPNGARTANSASRPAPPRLQQVGLATVAGEAALLAAMLPNPKRRSAKRAAAGVRRHRRHHPGAGAPGRAAIDACLRRPAKRGLALAEGFLYKPGFPKVLTVRRVIAPRFSRRFRHGRAEKENVAVAGAACAVRRMRSSARPMSRTRIPASCAARTTSI